MADYSDLKNRFKTDDTPTGNDYGELIDLVGSAKDIADQSVIDNKDGTITMDGTKLKPVTDNGDGTIKVNGVSYQPVVDNKDNTITINGKTVVPVNDNQNGTITVNTQTYTPADDSKVAHNDDITYSSIPSGADLFALINNTGKTKYYSISTNATTNSLKNCPVTTVFTLEIKTASPANRPIGSSGNPTYVYNMLELHPYNSSDIWTAAVSTDKDGNIVSTAWQKQVNTNDDVVYYNNNGNISVDGKQSFLKPVTDNGDGTIQYNNKSHLLADNQQITDIDNEGRAVVSMSITVTKQDSNSRFDYYLNRSKNNINMDFTLIDMISITDKNDSSPIPLDDSIITNAVSQIQSAGKRVVMLKPHIGIGYSDGFSRSTYVPSDHDLFFQNWKTILINHAKICQQFSIPVLSLGCEQVDQFTDTYYNKWQDIVSSIRSLYPDVKLTIASNSWRDTNSHKIFGLLDYIGCNWYPSYDYNHYDSEDDMQFSTRDTQNMLSGGGNMNRPNLNPVTEWSQLCGLVHEFEKPLWITEIGVVSKLNGLQSILPDGYDDNTSHYYKPVAIAMHSAIPFLAYNKEVYGISWWHCFEPFNYAPEGQTSYTPTYAETQWDKEVSAYGFKY